MQWPRGIRAYATRSSDILRYCRFTAKRTILRIAAHKLLEHKEWVLSFGLCGSVDFSEIDSFSSGDIRDLRNMQEHQLNYFKGEGRDAERWMVDQRP